MAQELGLAVEEMKRDGGEWREVRFYTKSSTADIFDALKTLDGLANVAIFAPLLHEKRLTIEQPPRLTTKEEKE